MARGGADLFGAGTRVDRPGPIGGSVKNMRSSAARASLDHMSTLELPDQRVMTLRGALDVCSDRFLDSWVRMPGGQDGRPATTMLAGMVDPGGDEPEVRPLVGHSMAVYEPDPRLSLVWPVPEDDRYLERLRDPVIPTWLAEDTHDWGRTERNWVVVLLGGTPIWQEPVWYLNWGSGIGGYVADFQPVYEEADSTEIPLARDWTVSEWSIGLAALISAYEATGDWFRFDPTSRFVPSPSPVHPIDSARQG